MKLIVFFALITVAVADIPYFTTGDDHLDVAALVADIKRLQSYADCFLDKAPCTTLTSSYKKNIPEAVKYGCSRCNPAQKHIFWSFLLGLRVMLPDSYQEFRQKYDPENIYMNLLEKEISKY